MKGETFCKHGVPQIRLFYCEECWNPRKWNNDQVTEFLYKARYHVEPDNFACYQIFSGMIFLHSHIPRGMVRSDVLFSTARRSFGRGVGRALSMLLEGLELEEVIAYIEDFHEIAYKALLDCLREKFVVIGIAVKQNKETVH
jgi:hypothetical protein